MKDIRIRNKQEDNKDASRFWNCIKNGLCNIPAYFVRKPVVNGKLRKYIACVNAYMQIVFVVL